MICREFTRKVEELALSELGGTVDSQLLAHERECSDCADWLQQRHALAGALQVLRNSAADAEAPTSVEHNVLRTFRHSVVNTIPAEANPLRRAFTFRLRRFFELGAYAAAAAALVISLALGVWYLPHRQTNAGDNSAQQNTNTTAEPNKVIVPQETTAQVATPQGTRHVAEAHPVATAASVTTNQESAFVPVLTRVQQAQGYTPMMLCDPLSCSGDEQVVRMELPASDGSQESQMADVIIGDDGLVRAIRIVQQ